MTTGSLCTNDGMVCASYASANSYQFGAPRHMQQLPRGPTLGQLRREPSIVQDNGNMKTTGKQDEKIETSQMYVAASSRTCVRRRLTREEL